MKKIIQILLLCVLSLCLSSYTEKDYDAMLEKGYAAEDGGEYAKAIEIYYSVLKKMPADSVVWISDINASLLHCHMRIGQLQKALSCGEMSLRLDEKMNDKERIASSLSNLASVLITANRLTEAERHLQRSVKLERELKSEDKLAVRLGMLAEVYVRMNKPQKALPLAKEALQLDLDGAREPKAAIRMSQYGSVLVSLKRYKEALPYLQKALTLHRKYGNRPSEAITLSNLGMLENGLHHTAEAEKYLQQGITLSRKYGIVQSLMMAHLELSRLYSQQHDSRAYEHLVEYNELKDSISSVQVQQQISDLEVKYETREKDKELEMKELLIQRQRLIYIGLTVMLLMTLVVVAVLIYVVREKSKTMQLKDHFLQIISHDLKNPALAQQKSMRVLNKSLGVLDTAELRTMTQRMAEDADAQVNLLYSLLDWAGMQTGRLRYQPIVQNLSSVVENVIGQNRAQAAIKNINLVVSQDDADHTIYADREMVEAMIRNLLSNAIKFSNAGSEIRISLNALTLTIDDDGIGYGADGGEKGIGLGLKLVREMANRNKISFEIVRKNTSGTLSTLKFINK